MASVFISYSRQDQAFVRWLYQALASAHREAWVDWAGIPPTAEWLKDIYSAIEASDTFVFVLSPDSLTSVTCGYEVAHALDTNKRIVPLVCREVGATDVKARDATAPLADLNWISFRPTDNLNTAFDLLLFALDTDLAYWHLASRLLVRAKEWESKRKNRSSTLRGKELREAEFWLKASTNKQPRPTALHLQYITASRSATNTLQRQLLAAVSGALMVTLILAVIGYTQFRSAQAGLAVANSRALAAQAINLIPDHPDLALLLSVEAGRQADTIEARDSLLRALEGHRRLSGLLHGNGAGWASVAFSPRGNLVAGGGVDGTILFWDGTSLQRLGASVSAGHATAVTGLAFSADGRLLATVATDKTLTLWDTPARRIIGTPVSLSSDGPLTVAFSPDGQTIAIGGCGGLTNNQTSEAGDVWLWQVSGQHLSNRKLPDGHGCVDAVTFSPGGSELAAGRGDDAVTLLNAASLQASTTLLGSTANLGSSGTTNTNGRPAVAVTTLAYSPDGKILAGGQCGDNVGLVGSLTGCAAGEIQLWNVTTHRLVRAPLIGHSDRVSGLAFSHDGAYLISGSNDNSIIMWDLATGKSVDQFATRSSRGGPGNTQGLAVSPDGMLLASASTLDADISLWSLVSDQPLAHPLAGLGGSDVGIDNVTFSPDGRLLAAVGCNVVSASSSTPQQGAWWLWDSTRQRTIGETLTGTSPQGSYPCLRTAAFSPDDRLLATDDESGASAGVTLWDVASRQASGTPLMANTAWVSSMAFSPNGHLLAAGGCDPGNVKARGIIWLWDASSRQLRGTFHADAGECVTHLAFSPNNKLLAAAVCLNVFADVGCTPAEAQLWDVASGRMLGRLVPGQNADISGLAVSPDSASVALLSSTLSASGHGITIWDVATRQLRETVPISTVHILGDEYPMMAIDSSWSTLAVLTCGNDTNANTCTIGIQLWSLASHHVIGTPLSSQGDGSLGVALNPAGNELISWGGGPVISWELNTGVWSSLACRIANRNLTQQEWARYVGAESYERTCPDLPAA